MYEVLQAKILREIQFQASVHGAELKGGKDNSTSSTSQQSKEPQIPLFGDPKDYSHLSAEERQRETEKMMGQHEFWSRNPLNAQTKGK